MAPKTSTFFDLKTCPGKKLQAQYVQQVLNQLMVLLGAVAPVSSDGSSLLGSNNSELLLVEDLLGCGQGRANQGNYL